VAADREAPLGSGSRAGMVRWVGVVERLGRAWAGEGAVDLS
jgi:hypothetical protein